MCRNVAERNSIWLKNILVTSQNLKECNIDKFSMLDEWFSLWRHQIVKSK